MNKQSYRNLNEMKQQLHSRWYAEEWDKADQQPRKKIAISRHYAWIIPIVIIFCLILLSTSLSIF